MHELKPHLDKLEQSPETEHWQVDLNNPHNISIVETNNLIREEVEDVIQKAGFKAVAASE